MIDLLRLTMELLSCQSQQWENNGTHWPDVLNIYVRDSRGTLASMQYIHIFCSYRIFFEIASFIHDIQGTSTDTRLDSCNLHSVTDIHRMESIYILYIYLYVYIHIVYIQLYIYLLYIWIECIYIFLHHIGLELLSLGGVPCFRAVSLGYWVSPPTIPCANGTWKPVSWLRKYGGG